MGVGVLHMVQYLGVCLINAKIKLLLDSKVILIACMFAPLSMDPKQGLAAGGGD